MRNQTGENFLQNKFGNKKRANAFYNNQMLDFLNDEMREFLSKQSMMFISTANAAGNCDASFRGGYPGFIRDIGEDRIIYPEYRGNGVMASLGNIVENPHIGLMIIDFFEHTVGLHINGKATIIEKQDIYKLKLTGEQLNDIQEKEGDRPEQWVLVKVEEAYIHCSKHIPLLKPVAERPGETARKSKEGDFFRTKRSTKIKL
ncbi:pyridoxamine 5'-phosphate oxidase family protein [Aquibacillus kalidii]|uniref:pyridoxamine 5'-phosphate oxidase family protein n=1 Tax=Aquibacillus kalidii TaxID=2762597 RepID=UPI001644AAD0|nr:pyridoxamine 5'-phosphate oxidase family protein [Aquibacillus kalidii]